MLNIQKYGNTTADGMRLTLLIVFKKRLISAMVKLKMLLILPKKHKF